MAYGLPDWLTGSSSSSISNSTAQPARPKSSDGGFVAPDRSTRELCYESRDLLFECLDQHDVIDAVTHDAEARRVCGKETVEYERDCAKSWIKYFKEKRIMEYNRDQTIAKIKADDAEMAAQSRAERKKNGSWF